MAQTRLPFFGSTFKHAFLAEKKDLCNEIHAPCTYYCGWVWTICMSQGLIQSMCLSNCPSWTVQGKTARRSFPLFFRLRLLPGRQDSARMSDYDTLQPRAPWRRSSFTWPSVVTRIPGAGIPAAAPDIVRFRRIKLSHLNLMTQVWLEASDGLRLELRWQVCQISKSDSP